MSKYIIRSLSSIDIPPIHKLLYYAFEQYNKDHYISLPAFKVRLERAAVNMELSYGAFIDGEIIGVMLNSIDHAYAFDYITAVHPDHRGNHIAIRLFHASTNKLKEEKILVYRSEIYTQNNTAYVLYKNLGMNKTRELCSFKGDISEFAGKSTSASRCELQTFTGNLPTDIDHLPSWENSSRIINTHKELYYIYYIKLPIGSKIIGYAIVQKDRGIIRQFHVETSMLRTFYAKQLFSAIAKDYSIIRAFDVDTEWNWLIGFFEKIGLEESKRIHEMEIVLNERKERLE